MTHGWAEARAHMQGVLKMIKARGDSFQSGLSGMLPLFFAWWGHTAP